MKSIVATMFYAIIVFAFLALNVIGKEYYNLNVTMDQCHGTSCDYASGYEWCLECYPQTMAYTCMPICNAGTKIILVNFYTISESWNVPINQVVALGSTGIKNSELPVNVSNATVIYYGEVINDVGLYCTDTTCTNWTGTAVKELIGK